VLDHARADLDQALADGRELGLCKRVCLLNSVAHGEHQPVGRGVEREPHLIGRRPVTRYAVRRKLRFAQLDPVLCLPALAVDVFIKTLRRAFERGDDVADVDLLAHASRGVSPASGCNEHSSRATTLRGRVQLPAW
jgi:hypothetical protein